MARAEEIRARWLGGYPLITPSWVRLFLSDWAFSSEKAKEDLGYRITPLREGLKQTLSWLEDHGT